MDLIAKLKELSEDGRASLLMDGVVRAIYRDREDDTPRMRTWISALLRMPCITHPMHRALSRSPCWRGTVDPLQGAMD